MLFLLIRKTYKSYRSFLNLIHFLLANTQLVLIYHTTYPWLPLKPFFFFQTPHYLPPTTGSMIK